MSNNCSSSILSFKDEEEVKQVFGQLRFGKMKYCMFVRIGESSFQICKKAEASGDNEAESWQQFITSLPEDECRYGLFNFKYTSESDNVERSKLIMVNWVPGGAKIKAKMLAATYVKGMKGKLDGFGGGIFITVQGGTVDELDRKSVEKSILNRCSVK
eukprot:TRINITY_DN14905_c0_g1_i1.p1 TRINITY_DN14905_c0_g1~~TRINITY_DN14905_c0_g1_i1.p1  ORF type:complete len:158 (+),score=33.48 TRINITY_DN14905_c0_g1_i1:56-529(+)